MISALLQELVGMLVGDAAGAVADKPLTRLASALRHRLSRPLIVVAWFLACAAMILGWRLGARGDAGLLEGLALLLWLGPPVSALVLTILWWHRRDA